MKPTDFFAAVGDIMARQIGSPYREAELSASELDSIVAQIEMLAAKIKETEK